MPEFQVIQLPVDEAAVLLGVQPQTVRRRLRTGELAGAAPIDGGEGQVQLVPAETWLRVEDASSLLGVSTATVRSNIARGRLQGRRQEHGRWRVQLLSVLEDSRCDPQAVALFTGEHVPESEPSTTEIHTRERALHRSVFVRLSPEEAELLDRAHDRHGTQRQAIVFALQAVDHDDVGDVAELRAEHALYREQAQRAQAEYAGLRERAEGRLVDELYCHVCETWVPVEDCAAVELEDGRLEVFHEKHGHRSGAKFRSNTGLARRAAIRRDTAA